MTMQESWDDGGRRHHPHEVSSDSVYETHQLSHLVDPAFSSRHAQSSANPSLPRPSSSYDYSSPYDQSSYRDGQYSLPVPMPSSRMTFPSLPSSPPSSDRYRSRNHFDTRQQQDDRDPYYYSEQPQQPLSIPYSNTERHHPLPLYPSFPPAPTFPQSPMHRSLFDRGYYPPSTRSTPPPFSAYRPTPSTSSYTSSKPAKYVYEPEREEYEDHEKEEEQSPLKVKTDQWNGVIQEDFRHGVGFEMGLKKKDDKRKRRMRKLEREFGIDSNGVDEEGRIGKRTESMSIQERIRISKMEKNRNKIELAQRSGVDEKGRLIVGGRGKRMALRWGQAIGAIAVGLGSIGASLVRYPNLLQPILSTDKDWEVSFQLTHPKETPAPRGTAPLYALYFLPFLSFGTTCYLFVVRPFLYRRRFGSDPSSSDPMAGGLVVPLFSGQNGGSKSTGATAVGGYDPGQGWFSKKKSSNTSAAALAQPTINLIVDPARFSSLISGGQDGTGAADARKKRKKKKRKERRKRRQHEGGDTDSGGSQSNSSDLTESSDAWSDSGVKSREGSRKSLLSVIALEERWKLARSWSKKVTAFDGLMAALWSTVAIWAIGFGKRCYPGTMQGFW